MTMSHQAGGELGAVLFFVPIRFWETQEPETGRLVAHTMSSGEVLANPTADGFTYAYHDGYGHNVYMRTADCFETKEAAVAEALRRNAEKEIADEAELDRVLAAIKGRLALKAESPRQ